MSRFAKIRILDSMICYEGREIVTRHKTSGYNLNDVAHPALEAAAALGLVSNRDRSDRLYFSISLEFRLDISSKICEIFTSSLLFSNTPTISS